MDEMRDRIVARLEELEREEDIKILLAVESGSRAWGFEGPKSDWDVRFIYLRSPEWYLSIDERKRDVIERELEDGLDVSGWDIQKTLLLFRKSNPSLLEWFDSPIVYKSEATFLAEMRTLRARVFNPKGAIYHYLHMARGNFREYLKRDAVRVKKYLYVLRPVLASLWIRWHGTMPPTLFDAVIDDCECCGTVDATTLQLIRSLLEEKKRGFEQELVPKIEVINEFAEQKIAELELYVGDAPQSDRIQYLELDQVMWDLMDRHRGGFAGRMWYAEHTSDPPA